MPCSTAQPFKQKQKKEKREEKKKQPLADFVMICIFLGVLLQDKRLEGASESEIFEGINLSRIGENPK